MRHLENLMKPTDANIQRAVLRELEWDTRVDVTDVGVTVDHGVVTLRGSVDSWAKRAAAGDAAQRVFGVLDVANDLKVGSFGTTDTQLARRVRHALEWDVFVPDTRIHSTVEDGWVTLTGQVDNWAQHEDAVKAIRNLEGVRGVLNELRVKPTANPPDIQKQIEEALERRARREAARIHVEVRDGYVTLVGHVHTLEDKVAALGAARGTAGVRDVTDKLIVEPSHATQP